MVNLKFELKKIIRGRKILTAIVLSLLISSVLFVGNHMNQYKISNKIVDDYYPWYEKLANHSRFLITRAAEKGVEDHERDKYLKPNESLEIVLMELFQLADRDEWGEVPNKLLELYDKYEDYSQEVIINPLAIPENKINSEREYYKSLSKQNLPYEDNEYSITGANFLKSVVDKVYGLPLALLLLLLSIGIFSEENINGMKKIRNIQPVKRINIFYGKIIGSFIYALIFICCLLFSSYLIGGIFGNGFGSLLYPVQRGPMFLTASKDSVVLFELMTIGKYILLSTTYYLVYILFILSVVSIVNTLFKETLIVSTISVMLVSLGSLISKNCLHINQWIGGIRPKYPIINPFSYEFTDKMIQDLRLKPLIIVFIPICFSVLLVYVSYILTKITFIQNLFTRRKIKDGETSLKEYENKKRENKFVSFRFEMLKIWKRREIYMVTIIIFTLVSLYFYNSSRKYDQVYLGREDYYDWRLERTQESLDYFTEGIMHQKLKKDYESYLEFKNAYNGKDKIKIADSMINQIMENGERASGFMGYPGERFAPETIKINISELNEIKKRNVEPPLPNAYEVRSTPFDKFRTISDAIRYMDYSKRYQPSLTYIINGIFKDNLNYLILLIITMALAIGFTDEKEKSNTIRLMNIQPIESKRIYLGKLSAQMVVFVSIVLLSLGIAFTGFLISGKKVEGNYPAIHYESQIDHDYKGEKFLRKDLGINKDNDFIKIEIDNSFVGYRFRDMSRENMEMIVIFIMIGIMSLGFSMLISINIKNRWQTSMITILVFTFGYGFSTGVLKSLSSILPFIWVNQALVTSGEANMVFNTNFIDIRVGVVTLAIWILFSISFGIKRYNKKYGRG